MKPLAEYTSLKNEICRKLENKLIEIPWNDILSELLPKFLHMKLFLS
jgi:hypothetical protein